jgi:hypothetical protein
VKFGERGKSPGVAKDVIGFEWGFTRFDQALTNVDH